MDAGGVQKEFFMLLLKDILNPHFGMFLEDEESHYIWFREEVSYMYVYLSIIHMYIHVCTQSHVHVYKNMYMFVMHVHVHMYIYPSSQGWASITSYILIFFVCVNVSFVAHGGR